MIDESRLPVVIASGQQVDREGTASATELMAGATEDALAGTGDLAKRIGMVTTAGIMSKISAAPSAALARRFGISPSVTDTTNVGGNFPQWLTSRAADDIAAGRLDAVLIAGVETLHTQRTRQKLRQQGANPPDEAPDPFAEGLVPDPIIGDPRAGVSDTELAAGLVAPVNIYPMFESAMAAAAGRDFQAQREHVAPFLSAFSEVAAKNPYAWFPQVRSAGEISTITPENRLVSDPYTKLMTAFIQVNQAAAVVVTSLAVAREIGRADSAVFLWSGADCLDVWYPSARPDVAVSPGIRAAGGAALQVAGVTIDDIGAFDLYSCFPCAVELAADALGLSIDDERGFTVTGGLPYFGGPGNNYTLHAIAAMAERVREIGTFGLVSGLGWYATKHSIGIYGATPPPDGWRRGDTSARQTEIDETEIPVVPGLDSNSAGGTVVASTVIVDNDGEPVNVPAFITLDDGKRAVGTVVDGELAGLKGVNLVGRRVTVEGTPARFHVAS